jgi:uncharacterized protein YihD (DUF1040 family)
MKKIFITLLIFLSYLTCIGQNTKSFPQYYILEDDTVGIILSIEQAQKIDNDIEILKLLQTLSIECDSLDTYYIKIINGLEDVIVIYELKIQNLTEQSELKNQEIIKLKELISLREKQLILSDNQKKNDSLIIKGLKKDITKLKTKNVVTLTTGILVSVILVFLNFF